MDFEALTVGGIQLLGLVMGLTQAIKELAGLEGKTVRLLSLFLGAGLMALFQAMQFIPQPYNQIATIAVQSVAFGLASNGYYSFYKGIKAGLLGESKPTLE